MNKTEINHYLNNSLIVRMIDETHFNDFVKAIEKERELSAGLLTWTACVHLAVHKYFNDEFAIGDKV